MRRLARHTFTLCAAVSLMLCVVLCVLWVRSYSRPDTIRRKWHTVTLTTYEQRRLELLTGRGSVHARWDREHITASARDVRRLMAAEAGASPLRTSSVTAVPRRDAFPHAARFGFYFHRQSDAWGDASPARSVTTRTTAASPLWPGPLLTAVLPATWLRHRWRRGRAVSRGLCLSCGYDLRATPDRCPECGRQR